MKFSRFHTKIPTNFIQDPDEILQSVSSQCACSDKLALFVISDVHEEVKWCCVP